MQKNKQTPTTKIKHKFPHPCAPLVRTLLPAIRCPPTRPPTALKELFQSTYRACHVAMGCACCGRVGGCGRGCGWADVGGRGSAWAETRGQKTGHSNNKEPEDRRQNNNTCGLRPAVICDIGVRGSPERDISSLCAFGPGGGQISRATLRHLIIIGAPTLTPRLWKNRHKFCFGACRRIGHRTHPIKYMKFHLHESANS